MPKYSFCTNSKCDLAPICALYQDYKESLTIDKDKDSVAVVLNNLESECEHDNYKHYEEVEGE